VKDIISFTSVWCSLNGIMDLISTFTFAFGCCCCCCCWIEPSMKVEEGAGCLEVRKMAFSTSSTFKWSA
jgi:hypothetical protein